MVQYRLSTDSDLEDIHELHYHSMREANCLLETADLPSDLVNISNAYHENGGAFVVAILDETVIGIGGLCKVKQDVYELKHLYVMNAFRGRRVGTHLLHFLLNHSAIPKEPVIGANTFECMHAAQGLLKRNGFKVLGRFIQEGREYVYFQKTSRE